MVGKVNTFSIGYSSSSMMAPRACVVVFGGGGGGLGFIGPIPKALTGIFGAPGTKSGAGGTYSGCASILTLTKGGGPFALLTFSITGISMGAVPPAFKGTSKEDAAFVIGFDLMVFGAPLFLAAPLLVFR